MSRYYEEARELARRLTTWSLTLGEKPRRFVVCSGGGPGIMEAANRGAAEAGGKSIGLSIELPHEQWPNRYISPELNFQFHYFFMRKLWFAQLAKALIVFPGGFGTMDELWEMLTLLQTGKLQRRNLILIYGRQYWDRVLNWREMVRTGTINRHEYGLLQFADTVDEAFKRIRSGLEEYHMAPDALFRRMIQSQQNRADLQMINLRRLKSVAKTASNRRFSSWSCNSTTGAICSGFLQLRQLRHFALQVLQESIGEMIERPLVAS